MMSLLVWLATFAFSLWVALTQGPPGILWGFVIYFGTFIVTRIVLGLLLAAFGVTMLGIAAVIEAGRK